MQPSPYEPPQQQPPRADGGGAIDFLVPTNPLAAVACWSGVFSCIVCMLGPILGPVAVITGIVSLKRGALMEQSGYGKATSKARSWIGIVTGGIGTILGGVIVWSMLGRHR